MSSVIRSQVQLILSGLRLAAAAGIAEGASPPPSDGAAAARALGGFRVVAAPRSGGLWGELPSLAAAVAVCDMNCGPWPPLGLQQGTAPNRGLTVRLTRSDADGKAAAGISSNNYR